MNLLIVTGMSGAGKSQAANALEDMGFYCVDNIPPAIIPSFVEISKRGAEEMGKLAIVTDIRGGNMFGEISEVLNKLKADSTDYKILFLDASDEVIERRFKENRRKHPLCERDDISVSEAIKKERKTLNAIRNIADYVIDTSHISNAQLKYQIDEMFTENGKSAMSIVCRSFGYKYGPDADSDMVFDVRCLRNPFYIDELKHKTGLEKAVSDYVMDSKESVEYRDKLFDFIDYAIPLYMNEGKSRLVISFACTGGKHRSVTFAEMLYRHLKEGGRNVSVMHRDINKK